MPGLKTRRGAGLAEMIVALTLSAIVSAAAATALAGTERYMRRARATSDARRVLREAGSVLASELRAVSSDSLRVRGDTAVDFLGLVGVSVVCVSSGNVLVLPPDVAAGGLPYSSWRASPEAGDVVAVFDTANGGMWRAAVVDSASTRTDGAGCKPSSGLLSPADSAARRPVTRVVLRSSLDSSVAIIGTPVRVMRSARYALTRAADGSWSLSYRRCTTSSCGVAQPVAGPFAAPSDSGLVFTNVAGESRIEVAFRTLSTGSAATAESARLRVTLRNRVSGAP
jgi:type II secretory pathway pseudopilin PulG